MMDSTIKLFSTDVVMSFCRADSGSMSRISTANTCMAGGNVDVYTSSASVNHAAAGPTKNPSRVKDRNDMYVDADGVMENAGFLDYRVPVASDLPPIETVILEIPNPGHPYGVRGVGETPIVPPLAAIANAVSRAAGVRMTELPMSPPRLLKAIIG